MKSKEELAAMKEEVEALNKKLAELTDDELKDVAGAGEVVKELDRDEIGDLGRYETGGHELTLEKWTHHIDFRRNPVWDEEP